MHCGDVKEMLHDETKNPVSRDVFEARPEMVYIRTRQDQDVLKHVSRRRLHPCYEVALQFWSFFACVLHLSGGPRIVRRRREGSH